MVMLLRKDNLKFLTVVTDCLHLLTLGHQESKAVMLHCNGPGELVRIIQTYSYEKLLWTATRVLKGYPTFLRIECKPFIVISILRIIFHSVIGVPA